MSIRILLADDSAVFRDALRMLLESTPGIDVVGEVEDGHLVLDAVSQTRPDLVFMDITLPGLDGIEATRQIRAQHAEVKVIGCSAHEDAGLIAAMSAAGAVGYLSKWRVGANELVEIIRRHTRG